MKRSNFAILVFAWLLPAALTIRPDIGYTQEVSKCDRCQAKTHCTKVCHLVCEEKKVEVTCWGCECEEFCVQGPSTLKCKHCKELKCACGDGLNSEVASKPKAFSWTSWLPGVAALYTKKKLMKRITVEKVPSQKWVVEKLCPDCLQQVNETKNNPSPLGD